MEENSALNIFPKTRLKPYDGMSVTAEAWSQAHDEHRRSRQAHDLLLHGSGVIWGLEVVANDPPDQYVFISPGAAIDQAGNIIVVGEPVAYDFGNTVEGQLYLLLGYGERETGGVDKEVRLVHSEYVIAARPSLPKRPAVELARVFLPAPGRPVASAKSTAHPTAGELDLRFRAQVAPRNLRQVHVGLTAFGKGSGDALTGWDFLSGEASRAGYQLVIDQDVTLSGGLECDFVYISGRGTFKLDTAELKGIQAYLETGKSLFFESFDNAAEVSFQGLFEKLGLTMKPVVAGDALFKSPYLFVSLPLGGVASGQVQVGKQVIFSNAAYALAWSGKFAADRASRAEIRAAHEWGINLIEYILGRAKG